ncbi:MAG: sigma-54 dependent transcriptional regulator, partial [Gemmataceae bacterium]|nr:sigma-54 dependent transcriptional regulator [Gemmataceae bacterium]
MNPFAVIVDDEEAVCWSLARALRTEGFDAEIASSAEAGLKLISAQTPDVVFLDVRLPGIDGITALARLRESHPGLPVVVMTAYGDLATAVGAVQGGAFDYLTKPFDLGRAIQLAGLARQRPGKRANPTPDASPADDEMVGDSPVMQQVFRSIALAAAEPVCVLVTGESGTGKELVARALHRHSRRSAGPFLPVHAAALSPSLVESELFGHARGAFTGADAARTGLLALAHGGTIFLDEVAEIPPSVQVKLLRALESGEVLPVGADTPTRHDFRIIAATNRDLARLVDEGKFREDLLFRLNVFRIHLPPLRDRIDDIPTLVAYFLRRFAPDSPTVPAETIRHLQQL